MLAIGGGKARILPDICALGELFPVAVKVLRDVAAILKAVHDIGELIGVAKTKRVAGFVEAGEVNNRIAQQRVRDVLCGVDDVDLGAAASANLDGLSLAVQAALRRLPDQTDQRARAILSLHKVKLAVRRALPAFERPSGQIRVAWLTPGGRVIAWRDPKCNISGGQRARREQQEASALKQYSH